MFRKILLACLFALGTAPAGAQMVATEGGRTLTWTDLNVFLDWDAERKRVGLALEPGFRGEAGRFALLIATPSRPEVDQLSESFFDALGAATVLKRWDGPRPGQWRADYGGVAPAARDAVKPEPGLFGSEPETKPGEPEPVRTIGRVRPRDVRIFATVEELSQWLREARMRLGGGSAFTNDVKDALTAYQREGWTFTVIIASTDDEAGGVVAGRLAPVRLTFAADRPVLPARLLALMIGETKLELDVFVQSPTMADLPGDLCIDLPRRREFPDPPGTDGRTRTKLRYSKKLTPEDLQVLEGSLPYGAGSVGRYRWVRDGSGHERMLHELVGLLRAGRCLTAFHKTFLAAELTQDLEIAPRAHVEYEFALPYVD